MAEEGDISAHQGLSKDQQWAFPLERRKGCAGNADRGNFGVCQN